MSAFLSCDWGTTSFRLRLVATDPFAVLAVRRSEDGALAVRDRAARDAVSVEAAFRQVLAGRARELLAARPVLPGLAPIAGVIVSGMASSTIGWHELPYATLPFPLDGSAVRSEEIGDVEVDDMRLSVTLLSGLASEDDVMRGEETEVLGLLSRPGREELRNGSFLVLPGTHSKHVRIDRGAIVGFSTYMTGELFAVLSKYSILRHSVASESSFDAEAFRSGVSAVKENGAIGALFKTRTNQVLRGLARERPTQAS